MCMVTPLRKFWKDGLKFHKIFGLEEDIFPRSEWNSWFHEWRVKIIFQLASDIFEEGEFDRQTRRLSKMGAYFF